MIEFSVNDLLQIHSLEERPLKAETPQRRSLALIRRVQEDRLLLAPVRRAGEPLPHEPEIEVIVEKPTAGGVLRYRGTVITVHAATSQPHLAGARPLPSLVEIKISGTPELVQRRAFYRVPVNCPMRYRVGRHAPLSEVREFDPRAASGWSHATLVNLSESGACLSVGNWHDPGEHLVLELPLDPPILLEAVVGSGWEGETRSEGVLLRVAFAGVDAGRQNRIRRFVFQQQRRICQQRPETRDKAHPEKG